MKKFLKQKALYLFGFFLLGLAGFSLATKQESLYLSFIPIPEEMASSPDTNYTLAYQALLDYADSTGKGQPLEDEHYFNDSLIKANTNYGWQWDVQYLFNTSASEDFSYLNYASPGSFTAEPYNGAEFLGRYGYKPLAGASNYLNTNYAPLNDAQHFTQNANTFYVMYIANVTGRFGMGSRESGKDIFFRNGSSSIMRNNSGNSLSISDTLMEVGDTILLAISRTASDVEKVFVNGVEVASETGSSSSGLTSYEQYIGAVNEASGAGAVARHNFLSVGYGAYVPDSEMDELYELLLWRFNAVDTIDVDDSTTVPPAIGTLINPGLPNLATNSSKLTVEYDMFLSDYHAEAQQSEVLFDGDISTHPSYDNTVFINPGYEVIPGTGLTGQCLIIDLKGQYLLDSIRVLDGASNRFVGVFVCPDFIFEPDTVAQLNLDSYNKWYDVNVQDTARYLIFNNPNGTINGVGEIEIWGERLSSESLAQRPIVQKEVDDVWGFTTHDYDHVPSLGLDGLYNIADINFTKIWRTYVETEKSFDNNDSLITENTQQYNAGGLDGNQIELVAGKGGKIFLSFTGNLETYAEAYPEAARGSYTNGVWKQASFYRDLPNYQWDTTLTDRQNEENQYNPANWAEWRDLALQVANYIKDNNYTDDVVLQMINEYDATWKTDYVRLNAFQTAALWSMLWDGHEGQYGQGVKDVDSTLKLSSLVQAYNNYGYTKRQVLWFQYHRGDQNICWDLLSVNTYCTTKNGFQWSGESQAKPPENTFWIREIQRQSNFAHSLGKEFMVSEFMADATFHDENKNRVIADTDSLIQEDWQLIIDTTNAPYVYSQYHAYQYEWDSIFLIKYDSLIQHLASAWNARMFLMITPWVDYATGYHIRDNHSLQNGSPYINRLTYSSSGIAYRRDFEYPNDSSRGNLRLKPWGLWFKEQLYEQLDGYTLDSYSFYTDSLHSMNFTNGSITKTVFWDAGDNHSRPAFAVSGSLSEYIVSDSAFAKSTVVTTSDLNGNWSGVSSLPDDSTYTLAAEEGQPYGFNSIYEIDSTKVVKTDNNITFFRKTFELTQHTGLNARLRMTVDDGMEIYINGTRIAREDNSVAANRQSLAHDLYYTSGTLSVNGYNSGDAFDTVFTMNLDTVFVSGINEIVLVVRNKNKVNDLGGFSFRLDLDKQGSSVIKEKASRALVQDFNMGVEGFNMYPNPTNSKVTIELIEGESSEAEVFLFEAHSGKLLSSYKMKGESELDLSNYAAGFYVIQVVAKEQSYSKMLVKE